jgi:hypothetical protein
MNAAILLAAALSATTALAQSPTDAMKAKMKAGLYAYKMEMDMGQMPGMPAGMGKQSYSIQHCVTQQDIEKGQIGKGRDGKSSSNCEMKDFRMSGNTATYKMVCKGESEMVADSTVTFVADGFNMDTKTAMNHGGQKMNMAQKVEGRYLGPCPAGK